MRQESDSIHNYTVAKITMDCDFIPATTVKKVIKKEPRLIDYWVLYKGEAQVEVLTEDPENPSFVHEKRTELCNVLDEHGEFQWENDPSGATEKAYQLRYLDANGNETTAETCIYRAAFVGCTYHCG